MNINTQLKVIKNLSNFRFLKIAVITNKPNLIEDETIQCVLEEDSFSLMEVMGKFDFVIRERKGRYGIHKDRVCGYHSKYLDEVNIKDYVRIKS